jgi:hypothetical protein
MFLLIFRGSALSDGDLQKNYLAKSVDAATPLSYQIKFLTPGAFTSLDSGHLSIISWGWRTRGLVFIFRGQKNNKDKWRIN